MRLPRPFRRPRPIVDARDRCGTWRVGELAVCERDQWEDVEPANPRVGDVLRVAHVADITDRGARLIFLGFAGKPANIVWCAAGFRKPVADDQAAEAEFTALLRAPSRQPVGAPVAAQTADAPIPELNSETAHV